MLFEIFSIISPVFICALIGFTWVRQGHDFDTGFVSKLVTNVGAPCLIFSTFQEIELDMQAFTTMLNAAFLSVVVLGVAGFLILKAMNLSQRAFLPSQMFPNCGNMGLPLCLLAFGDEGLALGLTYFTVNVVFGFTLGMSITSGNLSFRELFRNPMFYAVLLTAAFFIGDLQAPAWLFNTTKLLGGLTIPLMLIALGVSLAQFRISTLKLSAGLSVLRLSLGFATGLGLSTLLGLEGAARGILIMQNTMPVAVITYLFALRYQQQPTAVAGSVVLSTLISFLSLPLLLWFVLP